MDRLLRMVERLSKWSEALNPVVSMLLEQVGAGSGESAMDETNANIESWLDLTEN